jgi:uncharacterized hydrophobic protein (TIGR00271 family)
VIDVEIVGESTSMAAAAELLDHTEGVSRVRLVPAIREGQAVVSAAARPRAVDTLLEELRRLGVPDDAVRLTRLDVVGRAATGQVETGLVWEDLLGIAWLYSRPIARYLAFMVVAGVIGSYGVIDDNEILIVGAMAVAPDLLPIVAIAIGVVGCRGRLAGHGLLTLALGLAFACAAAATSAFTQDQLGLIPSGFDLTETGALGGLTVVSNETIVVALAAGVAGMLALETRAITAVGVAISVTTIPAAADLGVAVGLGALDDAGGALEVLSVNVVMLVVGASVTLALQQLLMHRARGRRRRSAAA